MPGVPVARRVLGAPLLGLLAALGCASDRRTSTTSAARHFEALPTPAAVVERTPACSTATALPVGVSEHGLTSGGLERRFLVYLPLLSDRHAALPLVFNLHGSGGTPEEQLATSQLEPLADARHFALVAPAAVGNRWNVPPEPDKADDVRFISDIIDALSDTLCVDASRVYSTGFSGGGRMSSQLACDLSERIAAIAAIGGVRFPGPCTRARHIPVLAFHGTADQVNPYDGGGQPYWGTGVHDAVQGWASHNGCLDRTENRVAPAIDRISYGGTGCGDVVLYRIDGFGHAWPGAIIPDGQDGTANDILWSFFLSHPLPPGE
jgi:polyhydroxybutyrate depolymerase